MADWTSGLSGDLPTSDRDDWDGGEAQDNLFDLATDGDEVDTGLLRRTHAFYDADEDGTAQAHYKGPAADVIGGEATVTVGAIKALWSALQGGRGGFDVPSSVQEDAEETVQGYREEYGMDDEENARSDDRSTNGMSEATLEQKHFTFEVKQVSVDTGEFEGYAAVSNKRDQGNDLIPSGAFEKTLQEQKDFPLQLDHNPMLGGNVGLVRAEEDEHGLKVQGEINTETQVGRENLSRLKHFADSEADIGMSIGYEAVKSDFEGDTRILREIKLFEVTLTLFPMNREAQVTDVATKAAAIKRQILGDEDFLNQLAQKTRPLLAEDDSDEEPGTDEEPGDHSDVEEPRKHSEDWKAELAQALASEA